MKVIKKLLIWSAEFSVKLCCGLLRSWQRFEMFLLSEFISDPCLLHVVPHSSADSPPPPFFLLRYLFHIIATDSSFNPTLQSKRYSSIQTKQNQKANQQLCVQSCWSFIQIMVKKWPEWWVIRGVWFLFSRGNDCFSPLDGSTLITVVVVRAWVFCCHRDGAMLKRESARLRLSLLWSCIILGSLRESRLCRGFVFAADSSVHLNRLFPADCVT